MIRALIACVGGLMVMLAGGTAAAGTGLAVASGGIAFVQPVHGAWISQGFGCSSFAFEPVDAACPGGHWHSGVDLAAARGTPVVATLPGVVRVIASITGYGLHAIVDHGGGLTSLYAHLDSVTVGTGDLVSAGAEIGTVGSSGNATGPHLHFEIRRDGIAEDPLRDLAQP